MSLTEWRKDGKMSSKKKVDVAELVKKYREKYPYLDRDLLRKLIRLECKLDNNPSELRKLDRHLKKAFQNKETEPEKSKSKFSRIEVSEDKIEAYAFAEWLAKQWKIFQSLDELFKIERRIRKELGGSQ
jgi:hypothetical protein